VSNRNSFIITASIKVQFSVAIIKVKPTSPYRTLCC